MHLHQKPLYILLSFSILPPGFIHERNTGVKSSMRAYLYALEAGFPKLPNIAKSFVKLLDVVFSTFLIKNQEC
jgi:hypothetical protein